MAAAAGWAGLQPQESLLLQLPDPCLLAVLQCQGLADCPVWLCSAARAHSRLHQAAVLALNSVNKVITSQQQVDDSLLPYLRKHGQHVDSVALTATAEGFSLCQLGPILQLTSLELKRLNLQLQPGNGFEGVPGAAPQAAAA
jgi:hypothetical protein